CNTGACHGAARGKDGFRLSLFGFDPERDYNALTRELPGRRINLALPHDSLLLTKATGVANHSGGELFTNDSHLYATLLRWLEAGAPNDPPTIAKVTGLEVLPLRMVLNGEGATQQLVVRAKYSDGTDRDVTRLATFITNNETSAKVSGEGVIAAGARGEAFVMARFDAYTVGSQAIVLPKDLQFAPPPYPAANFIDDLVAAKHRKLRITPSDVCSDEVFLRRASIDIVGQLPSRAEHDAFLADADPQKRAKLVDRLLDRKEFVELWVMKFAELLQIRSNGNVDLGISYKSAVLFYDWLAGQLGSGVPIHRVVAQMLSASGSTFQNPPTNFYQIERDNLKLTENVAQVFMGMRVQCAQCHNHPFDRWTMDDYYGFAAFFSQVGRKQGTDPRDRIIFNAGGGEVKHPVGGRVMAPKFLGGDMPNVQGRDRREVLAEWLASPQNPFFAKNLSNVVWAHFFGRGIVEPVDDVRVSNPPSNPELLEALGAKLVEYDYDFKRLVRDICTSRTYQLSTTTNDSNRLDVANFSHAAIRRVRAEVLYDMVSQATGTMEQNKFRGLPQGSRAVQIADGQTSTYFLTTFGRASRETVCSCEVKMDPNLSQALHLLNGDTVHGKIRGGGVVARQLERKASSEQIIEELYLGTLCRKPTPAEIAKFVELSSPIADKREAFEDVLWALLNTKEFLFNH
ncbi:MAG TPA: DUF1549 and DUF1553 domain-containing protein, partial [Pirellulales bacterium]|nr:DUF1549 and DUF1553 domain-containing protein [Pirellulales bacterium]